MNVFLSHNSSDKMPARLLAVALVEQGVNVWFDEWAIRPGDSITGGIETGLLDAGVFVLVWSISAKKSNWVDTEVRAYLRRRVDDKSLRIIPVIIDDTPLPALVADYKGFRITEHTTMEDIAAEITGRPSDTEIARMLQTKLLDLIRDRASSGDPLPFLVCPQCGSSDLKRSEQTDYKRDRSYYIIECNKCRWMDWSEM